MAMIPDPANPRMYPGGGEPGLADDNELALAMLSVALMTALRDRAAMEREYLEVRRIQDEEIAALTAEIERREAKREVGTSDHGEGEAVQRGELGEDRPRQLPE
jgi:hypothetical protein